MFGFQKLDVYRGATSLVAICSPLADCAPRGYAPLADQLGRAAVSVPLNIAEGSGRFTKDAHRFYTIARRSALQCAAILDAFESLGAASSSKLQATRELLNPIVAMLTVMIRS